jgi:hypothetical protein
VRDDRLRREESRSIRDALAGELTGLRDAFNRLETHVAKVDPQDTFFVPDITSSVRVMPALLPKLGLLPPETVRQVIEVYAIIESFHGRLVMIDGTPYADRHPFRVQMPGGRVSVVAQMARNTAKKIDDVIATLSARL